jgi:hypothetical protein
MNNNPVSFIKVTTDLVINFITSAKKSIIFAKPAFFKNEIETMISVIRQKKISAELYMEVGDSAIRYGFGETSALKLICDSHEIFTLHTADRIRIAILVVDDRALVYTPNLSFIEEESNDLAFPNGFLCNENVTRDIVRQFETKSTADIEINSTENIIVFPGIQIPQLSSGKFIDDIKDSIERLEKNPAVDPASLRKVSFYRNNYKIVKMQVCGVRIKNKSVNIKPFYTLVPNITNERLKSSWSVFTSDDIKELQYTQLFEMELDKIKEQFKDSMFDAGRFGIIIDIKIKNDFIKSINELTSDFKSYLGNELSEESQKRFKKGNQQSNLKTILDKSRTELENYLLKLCPKFSEFKDTIFSQFRNLKGDYEYGHKEEDEIMSEFIKLFVSNSLKFTHVDEIIDRIDIILDWYDISDELILENDDFKKIIKRYDGLKLRENSIGYERDK